MLLIDTHCDTPSQILRLRDLVKDNDHAHVDFPKLKQGGVSASFFALYTPAAYSPDQATAHALKMLAHTLDDIERDSDVELALSPEDIMSNYEKGKVSILFGMENGSPIQESLPLLRLFYKMGVRYMTLTHNGDNAIADAASHGTKWHGLSPFGKEVVAEMNRLGMIIDVAHASDETFYDCIRTSKTPIVSTHSCCRALAHHRRNFTDDMLRAIADVNGVIQINFYPAFLRDDFAVWFESSGLSDETEAVDKAFRADPGNPEKILAWHQMQDRLAALENLPSYKDVVDHIDHAVKIAGIDHVGIGSDFDGICVPPKGVENVSKIGVIFDEMRLRGYSENDIEKVAGTNFMRVFKDVTDFSLKYR